MTELIPRSNRNDDYANTTNVKLSMRNNAEQSGRLEQLSASRLQPFYLNGQAMTYLPQVVPIVMPFPYSVNQAYETNNRSDGEN